MAGLVKQHMHVTFENLQLKLQVDFCGMNGLQE